MLDTPPTDLAGVAKSLCQGLGFAFGGPIGSGAFKESFRAMGPKGEDYALKLLKPGFNPLRLEREIAAMRACSHPNIGGIIEINQVNSPLGLVTYLLEQFLPGGTLTERIRKGPMSPAEALQLGKPLVDALAYLAARQLVHRDIKPDNIMFAADQATPVIVDFGIVRDLAQPSLTKTFLMRGPGTPLFAPAEQLNNDKETIDWRADQFALAVTLSYCAFGFHPYARDGESDPETVDRVARYESQSGRFVAAAESAGLAALVKMSMPYPVQRFCLAGTLRAEFGT